MLAISQEELPTRITADKLEIPVSADFRSWVKADLIMKDRQIPEDAKLPGQRDGSTEYISSPV